MQSSPQYQSYSTAELYADVTLSFPRDLVFQVDSSSGRLVAKNITGDIDTIVIKLILAFLMLLESNAYCVALPANLTKRIAQLLPSPFCNSHKLCLYRVSRRANHLIIRAAIQPRQNLVINRLSLRNIAGGPSFTGRTSQALVLDDLPVAMLLYDVNLDLIDTNTAVQLICPDNDTLPSSDIAVLTAKQKSAVLSSLTNYGDHLTLTITGKRWMFVKCSHPKVEYIAFSSVITIDTVLLDNHSPKRSVEIDGSNWHCSTVVALSGRVVMEPALSEAVMSEFIDQYIIECLNEHAAQNINSLISGDGVFSLDWHCVADSLEVFQLVAQIYRALNVLLSRHPLDNGRVEMGISYRLMANFADQKVVIREAMLARLHAEKSRPVSIRYFESVPTQRTVEQNRVESLFYEQLNSREFSPAYQPQVDDARGVVGLEVLLRYQPANSKVLSPDIFLPVMESFGLLNWLSNIFFERAITDFKNLKQAGYLSAEATLSLNIAPHQIDDFVVVNMLIEITIRLAVRPKDIVVELTEGSIITNYEHTQKAIQLLVNYGFKISLDDFGTGFSSLHHLQVLPISEIKIDRSFVSTGLNPASKTFEIIKSLASLAKALDLNVVAEGAESEEECRLLHEAGINVIQGYRYSKPVFIDELIDYLKEYKK